MKKLLVNGALAALLAGIAYGENLTRFGTWRHSGMESNVFVPCDVRL